MFSHRQPDNNRRPDISIRNSFDGGSQIVIDASVASFNSSARTNDNIPQQVVIAREKQKIGKYGEAAKKKSHSLLPCFLLYYWRNGPGYQKSLSSTNQT